MLPVQVGMGSLSVTGVVFLMPHLCFGGAERLASRICRHLAEEGRQVRVAVLTRKPGEACSGADWFAQVGPVIRLDEAGSGLSERLISVAREIAAAPLVLLGRSPGFHVLPELRAALPDLRVVSFQFNARELIHENRLYAPFINLIVTEGRAAAQALTARGELPERLAIIPSGPDLSLLEHDPGNATFSALRETGRPVVGFVGRLDAVKGPDLFVAICDRLREANATFVLAGEGPFAGTVDRMIAHYGLRGRIAPLGRVADANMAALYRALDIVVVPSLVDGRPLVVQEAQACGCAVVAARVGAIPDLIADGADGRLCTPGDIEEFAAATAELLADPAARRRMGETARRRVRGEGGLAAALPLYARAIAG